MKIKKFPYLVLFGILLIAIALFPDIRSFNGIGEIQLLILLIAIFLILFGIYGRELPKVYSTIAVFFLNAILMLMFLEIGLGIYDEFQARLTSAKGLDELAAYELYRVGHPYYDAEEGSHGLWAELNSLGNHYYPFVMWDEIPFSGTYVNIDEHGTRLTPDAICNEDSFVVHMYGGSTLFGSGAADNQTIPSFFLAMTSQLRDNVCVINLGTGGWVSTQGTIELQRQLQAGRIPDFVIFYDGYNDSLSSAKNGVAGGDFSGGEIAARFDLPHVTSLRSWFLTRTYTGQVLARVLNLQTNPFKLYTPSADIVRPIDDIDRLAIETANVYVANYKLIKGLSEEYDFGFAMFWQPTLGMGNKPLTDLEMDLLDRYGDIDERLAVYEAIYRAVEEASSEYENMHYIANIFDNENRPIYHDAVHVTPIGNEIVANEIFRLTSDALADRMQ